MIVLISITAVVLAAGCIWLAVRIVNRRELWAKRLAFCLAAVVIIGLVVGYPLSFPWVNAFLINHPELQWRLTNRMVTFYAPLEFIVRHCPSNLRDRYLDYRDWCIAVACPPQDHRGLR